MKKIALLLSFLFCFNSITFSQSSLNNVNSEMIKAVKKSIPVVVSIKSIKGHNKSGNEVFYGSGVVYDKTGNIITNYHVIESADSIQVITYDGKEYNAELIGYDEPTDIAVIKISKVLASSAKFADSDKIKQGQIAIAIGNPLGFSNSVSMGIVSAVKRKNIGLKEYEDFIQTDASINPGNSGGALINTNGEVIGINTAIVTGSGGSMGLGFAIPSNLVKKISKKIIETGSVKRAWIGISLQELDENFSKKFKVPTSNGAIIADVLKDSPAYKSGLKIGDVIIGYNGKDFKNMQELRLLIAESVPGKKSRITIFRNGKKYEKDILPIEKGLYVVKKQPVERWKPGIVVEDLNEKYAYIYGINSRSGAVITSIVKGSIAHRSGLKNGDLIIKIENTTVENTNDYYELLNNLKDSNSLLFLIRRQNIQQYILIKRNRETVN